MLQAAASLSIADEDSDLEEDDCENEVAPVSGARALTDRLAAGELGVQAGESGLVVALNGPRVSPHRQMSSRCSGQATWWVAASVGTSAATAPWSMHHCVQQGMLALMLRQHVGKDVCGGACNVPRQRTAADQACLNHGGGHCPSVQKRVLNCRRGFAGRGH